MKGLLRTAIQFFVTFFIFWWIFQDIDLIQVGNIYRNANPWWISAGILILIISLIMGGLQWFVLLRAQGVSISATKTLKLYWIALFFTNFLPGSLGGDIVRIYSLARYERCGKEGFAATVIDRFAGLFAMVIFSIFASIYLLFINRETLNETSHYVVRTVFFVFCVFIFMIFVLFSQRTFRIIFDVILGGLQDILLVQKVRDLHTYFHIYRKKSSLLFKVGIISMAIQFLRIIVHLCAACALGVSLKYFI
ncbi:MAG: lysylphosphatidylglycerol synthase transmembrane domain-containing protein, partial [Elusimicrobiota bacterium]